MNDDYENYNNYNNELSPIEPAGNPESAPEPEKKKKKKTRLAAKITALCLCCALLGGVLSGAMVYVLQDSTDEDSSSLDDADASVDSSSSSSTSDSSVITTTVSSESIEIYTSDNEEVLSTSDIYYNYASAVVGITTESTSDTNAFGQESTSTVSGTGFFITTDGYILTCAHVIEDADTVTVTTIDNETYEATVVGYDTTSDVGVLKVDSDEEFTCVVIGSIDDTLVGEFVCVIGNPLGELTYSTTYGIVSALDREINIDGTAMNVFQIDASVNSGNSGGPVFNQYGEVIGIVNAKSSGDDVEGIGFAIPIDDAISAAEDIIEYGTVVYPYLGIGSSNIDSTTASYYSLPDGVYVTSVEEGSCAEEGGIEAGDIITEMNGTAVTSTDELKAELYEYDPGDTITITVYREGSTIELTVTLGSTADSTDDDEEEEDAEIEEEEDDIDDFSSGSDPFSSTPGGR